MENDNQNYDDLRKRAENSLDNQPLIDSHLSLKDIKKLIHEIHVQQIELELQNDELKRSQENLLHSEEKYFEFYNLAPVGFFSIDEEGVVKEINLTLIDLLNIERKDILNNEIIKYIKWEERDIFNLFLRNIIESENIQKCELTLEYNDKITSVRLKGKKSVRNDEFIRVVVHDITDHIKNETRLKQLLKQLSTANETINTQNFELRELNAKLEMSKSKLNNTIKEKDEFLNSIYHDLTLVFSRFLILSESINNDENCKQNPEIHNISKDLYSAVKSTINLIDQYFRL